MLSDRPLLRFRPVQLGLSVVIMTVMFGQLTDTASAAGAPTSGTHEDSSSAVTLSSSWKTTNSTRDSGGGYATLAKPGSATFTFSGAGIRWMTRTNNYSGIAKVSIDGKAAANVDLYSASEKFKRVVYTKNWSKAGTHTIKIERTGKLNRSSSGRGISLDAFVVTDLTPPPVMGAPAVTPSHRGVALTWTPSTAGDVTAYRVYRKKSGGSYVRIAHLPADRLSYFDVGLVHQGSYSYRLGAVDSSGNVSAAAPSTAAVMPAAPVTKGRYAACPTATRTVTSAAELKDALTTASSGTVIRLAPGTYSGYFATSAVGTASQPVWICGSRSAIINPADNTKGTGFALVDATNVILTGLTIKNAQKGVTVIGGSHNTVSDLHISDIGDEAIHLRSHASDNFVTGNLIERTGQLVKAYGEAIYIGSDPQAWCAASDCEADSSDRNVVDQNTIRATTAEAIEVKAGASDGDIRNNVINGSTMSAKNSGGWIVIKGNGWLVEANRGTSAPAHGFTATYSRAAGWGRDNVFVGNKADVDNASGYGVWVQQKIGNIVSCSNTASVAKRTTNLSCQK